MIVVVGRVSTDAERRAELIRAGQAVAATSRGEDGCLNYRLYEDTEVENDFVFVEEWESDEALKAHFAAPHVAEFMGAITPTLTAPPQVTFHTVASSRDLSEMTAGA